MGIYRGRERWEVGGGQAEHGGIVCVLQAPNFDY